MEYWHEIKNEKMSKSHYKVRKVYKKMKKMLNSRWLTWEIDKMVGGNARTNLRTNERKSPCVPEDIVSFRAAARKIVKFDRPEDRPTNRPTDGQSGL